MLWILPLAILAFPVLYLVRRKPSIHRNGEKLKRSPDSLPLLGNSLTFLKPRHVLFDWFIRRQAEFGSESYEISVPSLPPGVVISSPENLEFVFKNESIITKGKFFKDRSWDLFGYGIINATGELWRAQRKAGLKFFGGSNLEAMIDEVLPEYYQDTEKQLQKCARDGTTLDLQQVLLDLTTVVVGHMAYDMSISATSPFSKAFDYASLRVAYRFQNPFYQFTEMVLPSGSKFRNSINTVRAFGHKIVLSARKKRSRAAFESLLDDTELTPSTFGSLIDSLLEAFNDDQIVADSAMNFLSAGRDTTAQSLTWMFYALGRNPHALEKLRRECDQRLPKLPTADDTESAEDHGARKKQQPRVESDPTDKDNSPPPTEVDDATRNAITVSSLQPTNIPYISAVFYESLRLYPPVPVEIKQCEKAITLPGDNVSLPAHAVIVWCTWALNRSPKLFGPDPEVFRPERWLDDEGKFIGSKMPSWELPVFNGGPRACLGKKMAELLAAWIVVRVVQDWDFEEIGDLESDGRGGMRMKERVSQSSLTLPMLGGFPVRVKRKKR